ncbi:hypothetical protein CsSME_00002013 [Camellia sinensis var. sinensis]
MPGWKNIRKRSVVKGFEVAFLYEDLKSFRRGHVEGIEGTILGSASTSPRSIGKGASGYFSIYTRPPLMVWENPAKL